MFSFLVLIIIRHNYRWIYYNGDNMKEISIYDVLYLDNPLIIDIRDNYSYNMGHIDNALNIPYYSLLGNYTYY